MSNDVTEPSATSRWSQLDWLFQLACKILVGGTLLVFLKDRLPKLLLPTLSHEYLTYVLATALLITVLVLVFRWIFAVAGEMRLLRVYLHEYVQQVPGQVYLWTILFSILLGTLGSITDNIIAFSAILAVYSVFDIWGQWLRDLQLKEAFRQIAREGSSDATISSKRQAIEKYYLDKPQMQRSATIMFFTFASLSLALAGNASHSVETKEWLHMAAYAIVIANIAISEVVIWRWRKTRDDVLGEKFSF